MRNWKKFRSLEFQKILWKNFLVLPKHFYVVYLLQLRHHALVSRTKSAPIPASKQRQAMLGLTHQGVYFGAFDLS